MAAKNAWRGSAGFGKKNGVNDLVMLPTLSGEMIVDNFHKRFMADNIYTYVGTEAVISVNPFKDISGLYSQSTLNGYKGRYMYEQAPHIYALADDTYRSMMAEGPQCIIVTGESGAGKTEACKRVMEFIAAVSAGAGSEVEKVKERILDANPLLEAFGNSKTLMNNNSSRFGKYMTLCFDVAGTPVGGHVQQYLLEKSRVVHQHKGERNFHIFYQLLRGCDAGALAALGLTADPAAYAYTRSADPADSTVPGLDDAGEFRETTDAMHCIGIEGDTEQAVLRTVAALLHLGNVTFDPKSGGEGSSVPASGPPRDSLTWAANLLGVEANTLEAAITSRTITTGAGGSASVGRGSAYAVPLNPEQASFTRDALSKALYVRLFAWLVSRINDSITPGEAAQRTIGVLDIAGFEIFEENSFEQLNINYVNEKLQQIFLDLTLKTEQEEYVREGVTWEPVDYVDNIKCVDLIEGAGGVYKMLDEECFVPRGSDENLADKLCAKFAQHEHFKAPKMKGTTFSVSHYAGEVTYEVRGFLDKNKDTLFSDLVSLAQGSKTELVRDLFAADAVGDKKRPPTVATQFKSQVAALCASLRQCHPHYVRCIKPNNDKKRGLFDVDRVAEQARYLGIEEHVRVRRAGFAFRQEYPLFLHRYKMLCQETWPSWEGQDPADGVEHLLRSLGIVEGQYVRGRTKIFVRQPQTLFTLEELRERKLNDIVAIIQAAYRSYRVRKHAMELRELARDIYHRRKERRRLSESLQFVGDRLHLADNPRVVKVLAKHGDDRVLFSGNMLKKEKGKSVKMAERILMVTERALYNLVPKSYKVNRRITFEEIGKITLSPLADGFFVITLPQSYDYVMATDAKTEVITILRDYFTSRGEKPIELEIASPIEYRDAKGTKYSLRFIKDDTVRDPRWEPEGAGMCVRVQSGVPPA